DMRMAEIKVTRQDFEELKGAVRELAEALKEAQKETRQEVARLDRALAELAESHRETREELKALAESHRETREELKALAESHRETREELKALAEAQKETRQEVARLDRALAELAESHRETREELKALAEAHRETREALNALVESHMETREELRALAEAQKETRQEMGRLERAVAELADAVKKTRQEVGRLSQTVGFGLEDIARVVLPGYLERHLGVKVDRLKRGHFTVNGTEYEIDLYGVGKRGGARVTVLGEVKHRIYAREVKSFVRLLRQVMPQIKTEAVKVMFGYLVHPSAEEAARPEGITLVASYER
ncbi:MAG: hypothetical protein HPY58_09670, partial [Firmicutes bacterium]|nr:hypothetical protein [Bacillota bacterium]